MGPFAAGSAVQVFAVTNGQKGALITQTTVSDANGNYSASLGDYTGPVLVEVSGSYLDEATGVYLAVSDQAPVRAALPQASGSVTLPVTALTEIAVRKTAGNLSAASIAAANSLVSSAFGLDIAATVPVSPTQAALIGASPAQKTYTLALAAISQLAKESSGTSTGDRMAAALAYLTAAVSNAGLSGSAGNVFQVALNDFLTANPQNVTGLSSAAGSGLASSATFAKSYLLSLSGSSLAAVRGLQFETTPPLGSSLSVNSQDETVLADSLALAPAFAASAMMQGRFASGLLTVAVIAPNGLTDGSFATLTLSFPTGTGAVSPPSLSVGNLRAIDKFGNPVTGVTLTIREALLD